MVINAKSTDLYKPVGKDMQGKSTQELYPIKGNGLFDGSVAIIFRHEGYLTMRDTHYPLIGDSHSVGVLSKVLDHMLGSGQ